MSHDLHDAGRVCLGRELRRHRQHHAKELSACPDAHAWEQKRVAFWSGVRTPCIRFCVLQVFAELSVRRRRHGDGLRRSTVDIWDLYRLHAGFHSCNERPDTMSDGVCRDHLPRRNSEKADPSFTSALELFIHSEDGAAG